LRVGARARCWGEAAGLLGPSASTYRENRGPTAAEQRIVDTCVYLCAVALERHERVLERERLARTDSLTDLPNRASFDFTLSGLACDQSGSWALLLLDLDNLKIVNDTFGHRAGDELLRIVAGRLAEAAAPHLVFRLGGDEFAILVRDTCTTEAIDKIVRQVRAAMAGPAACDGHVVEPIATMG